jgi:hypothetical protein
MVEQRDKSFEWLGLDLMVDDELRVWLLELNVSPDVSHSTAVTACMAPAATKGILDCELRARCAAVGRCVL